MDLSENIAVMIPPVANDGGQRFINEPHFQPTKFEDIASDAFRDGKIVAYREADGFSYVCGDATNCYSKENEQIGDLS